MAVSDEARRIAYSAGLPIAAVPFIERMLNLENCALELERRIRELERKDSTPPHIANIERR